MTDSWFSLRLDSPGVVRPIPLKNGTYKLRLWGAQGGCLVGNEGGRGAYSEGVIKIAKNETLYTYVGKQGICSSTDFTSAAPYRGGNNKIGPNGHSQSCTGGEATFIFLHDNIEDLLIVAGAGGGSGFYNDQHFVGGYGGPNAGDGAGNDFPLHSNGAKVNFTGKGARVAYPGKGGYYEQWEDKDPWPPCYGTDGSRLRGGDACATSGGSSGGGGAGYFGGGGGADLAGGGGGSSYASPLLSSIILQNGDDIFSDPNKVAEKGHIGNGFIIIEEYYSDYIPYDICKKVIYVRATQCVQFATINLLNIMVQHAAIYS